MEPKLNWLKAIRETFKVKSQDELSWATHLTKQTLHKYETGRCLPTERNKTRIAGALGMTVAEVNEFIRASGVIQEDKQGGK